MPSIFSNSSRRSRIAVVFLLISQILPRSLSDPRIREAGLFCGGPRAPAAFIPLFVQGMQRLSQHVTSKGRGHSAVTSGNVSFYTMAECHRDLRRDDCLQCYAASRTILPHCLPSTSGRIFLDGCFLRYDNYSFFNESVDPVWDRTNCTSTVQDLSAVGLEFGRNVEEMIANVTAEAVVRNGYAVSASGGVFGLAECWESVGRNGCKACLAKARTAVRGCLPGKEGRALNTGCYLRYSTEKFFSNHTGGGNLSSGVSRRGAFVAIGLSVLAFCMLCFFAAYTAYRRWKRLKQERSNLGHIKYSYHKSSLNFKYETLEKATNYFDPLNKLGQGGAGSVYKGTLPNGKTVAVKRLFFSTRQWVDEFFNEVNLISGIEHKNLVKLLGCSLEGPESLLVYEFVPNMSLEHHLFDKEKSKFLSWKERCKIIVGIAEGITFLHEGLELRIIHRDIKTSNVLLDDNFDAKIADFGLARCFAADKTHLSTGIAGTLGYMAPEYLVKGQLTEKADVYSFGVLVLEVVCSRKNTVFVEDSGSLLQTVWKLHKLDRLAESVDPCLGDDFPRTEASKVLRIGLLCTQASAIQRPSMAEVVRMLTDDNCQIPEPNQPPFLNTGVISTNTTRSSYSLNSSMSNPVTKPGTSNESSFD